MYNDQKILKHLAIIEGMIVGETIVIPTIIVLFLY